MCLKAQKFTILVWLIVQKYYDSYISKIIQPLKIAAVVEFFNFRLQLKHQYQTGIVALLF